MKIRKVTDNSSEKQWLQVPWRIYADDNIWIPHLKQDIMKLFNPKKNKLLAEGAAERWWITDDNGKGIGRIAAFVNPKTAHTEERPVGGMGFFESIDDQVCAHLLLDTARDWLKEKGMEVMDGPINFGEKNTFWGLQIMNFEDPPIYGTNYNPPYYRDLLENYGMQIYYNQLFFERDMKEKAQAIFWRKYNQLQHDPEFEMCNVEGMSLKKIAEDFRTVYNSAWVDHDGFKEMRSETAMKAIKAMKPVMDRRIIVFIYHKKVPVAFYINLPELNEIFRYVNGNMNWLGKLKFLYHKWRGTVKTMTGIVFGVSKEYHGKGYEGALIVYAEEHLVKNEYYERTVLTWIGDFNPRMLKVCQNLGATNYRTLATYRYLFDRSLPFERYPIIDKKS